MYYTFDFSFFYGTVGGSYSRKLKLKKFNLTGFKYH